MLFNELGSQQLDNFPRGISKTTARNTLVRRWFSFARVVLFEMPEEEKTEEEKQEEEKRIAELCADDFRTRTATREDELDERRSNR